jgi:two-component system cell cycle sensor histidine kinase/response regulator CckA
VSHLSPDAATITADPTQIEQVILNLIINARDAMPNGGRMTIETAAVRNPVVEGDVVLEPGNYVRLSVSDTGCGMSDDIKARIFDPLFTTKGEHRGTGLGLATVHGIVARHGGVIQVDSVEGGGSTFRIFLPRGESPQAGTREEAA